MIIKILFSFLIRSVDFTEIKYHLSWKLGIWDDLTYEQDQSNSHHSHEGTFFSILSEINRNETLFQNENISELISAYTCESIRLAKLQLVDDLKSSMVSEFHGLNHALGSMYRLDEIANRRCLWKTRPVLYKAYEKDMFDKTSFTWLDDLNCLRVQLAKMQETIINNTSQPSSNIALEGERLGFIEFLYECLIDNALNHKKFRVFVTLTFKN